MEERATAADKAAENGRNEEAKQHNQDNSREQRRRELRVKDKLGVHKTESQERLQSWVENLSKILNRDDPTNPVEEKEETEELE